MRDFVLNRPGVVPALVRAGTEPRHDRERGTNSAVPLRNAPTHVICDARTDVEPLKVLQVLSSQYRS